MSYSHPLRASGSPASAQGASEVGFLPVKKPTECTRALRPRVKRPPQVLRRVLNAGRWNLKDRLQTGLLYLRKRQKGRGEKRRAFPRGAQSARGAGRGAGTAPSSPALKPPPTQNTNVCGVGARYAYVCGEFGTVSWAFHAAPEPLTRFSEVGGVNVLWGQAQSTPRRSTPRRRSAPPPEGEAPGGFPLGSPPCRGAQGKMSVARRSLTFRAPALAGALPRTRSRLKCSPFRRRADGAMA